MQPDCQEQDLQADYEQCYVSCTETIVAQADEEAYSRSNYAEAMQLDCVEAIKNLIRRLDLLRTQVGLYARS